MWVKRVNEVLGCNVEESKSENISESLHRLWSSFFSRDSMQKVPVLKIKNRQLSASFCVKSSSTRWTLFCFFLRARNCAHRWIPEPGNRLRRLWRWRRGEGLSVGPSVSPGYHDNGGRDSPGATIWRLMRFAREQRALLLQLQTAVTGREEEENTAGCPSYRLIKHKKWHKKALKVGLSLRDPP